jgi:hypothetical protein
MLIKRWQDESTATVADQVVYDPDLTLLWLEKDEVNKMASSKMTNVLTNSI